MEGKEQPAADHQFDNRLISLLSHDVRQPLGMLKSLAMLLHSGYQPTPDGLMKMIESIERASDVSLEMCDNILPWIKWRLMNKDYHPLPLPLQELFTETIQQFTEMGETRNITIQSRIDANVIINTDKQLLLLINKILIDHALSYSNEQAVITIATQSLQQELIINIISDNSHISAEATNGLFHFHADQQYTSDKEKSTGIALMICKSVVEKMHGRIWAEKKEQGIVFCYALPC